MKKIKIKKKVNTTTKTKKKKERKLLSRFEFIFCLISLLFAIGVGLITVLIRIYGSYPEGVSFAILMMNILHPYIEKFSRRKLFGGKDYE